jgi:glutamine amidotransferase
MKIAIITSVGANFYSIEVALQRLGVNYYLTTTPAGVADADAAILPGVGTANYAMEQLRAHDLLEVIRNYKNPLLGICLGMQLLYEYSAEGNLACLGVIPGQICKFRHSDNLIVPHMGWNNLQLLQADSLLDGISCGDDVYFVHSYYAPINAATLASCNYKVQFTAIARYQNFYATQFHPEKSGRIGAQLLNNFIKVIYDSLSSN